MIWGMVYVCLGVRVRDCTWWTHLRQNLVQPLQGAVQMNLYPTRGSGDRLPPILHTPSFYKAYTNCAHACKLVNCLKSRMYTRSKSVGKVSVVEHLHVTAWGDLAHSCRMPTKAHVRVWTLHKYTSFAGTFGVHDTAHHKQMDAFTNESSSLLDLLVPMDIWEEA